MDKQEIKDRLQERYKRGSDAEVLFMDSIKLKHPEYEVKKSSREQDMFQHIDCFAGPHSYDVKSLKKKRAKDKDTDSNIIWVELKNVRGNKGWVYGKADRIAFELESEFICVNREDLKNVTESLIINQFTQYPQAYHLYGRTFSPEQEAERGYRCQDVMTFLYLNDIKDIIIERIPKKEIQS